MKLHLLVATLSVVTSVSIAAQTPATKFVDSARVEIDKAALANDTARLSGAVLLLDHALVTFPGDVYLLHYRGYARYRQAVNAFAAGTVQAASPFVEQGIT
ncbi:MAG: hypothetical protein M3Y64_03595, partial [Gemmatimonadota bacterium]|nr:hypothetical protein [Gemmatimonadota bacterium]